MRYEKYKAGGFNTPTGKIELYSTRFEAMGYDPLPDYQERGRKAERTRPEQDLQARFRVEQVNKRAVQQTVKGTVMIPEIPVNNIALRDQPGNMKVLQLVRVDWLVE